MIMAALILLVGWGPVARAPAQTASRAQVLLVLDAGIEAASGLGEALGAQLADLDVELVSEAAHGEIPAAALALARAHRSPRDRGVVWVAQQGADLLVFVVEPAADRTLLRSLPNADPSAFATQEMVAVIVRSSIEGLLSGAPIGFVPKVAKAAALPDALEQAAPPKEPALFVPELSVGYMGASFAKEVPWQHGARVAAGLADLFVRGAYAQLAVSLLRDERVVDQGVSLLLTRTPLQVVGGFRFQFGGFVLAPELGLGLELTRRHVQADAPQVQALEGRTRISSLLSGQLWLMRALGGAEARSWLALGGGIEAVLNNVDYGVEIRSGSKPRSTSILVSPRGLRPVAMLSLGVSL